MVLILAGDHIYKMDYQPFIAYHRRNRADVTVAVQRVPIGEAHRFGVLALDEDGRVAEWQEKPRAAQERPRLAWASTSSRKRALLPGSTRSAPISARDVIPAMLDGGARVFGYQFDGYWQDVGTVAVLLAGHMDLLDEHPGWTCTTATG